MRQGRGQAVHHHLHLTADQVGHRRRAAAIRNVHHENPGVALEHLHAQVRGGAAAQRGIVEPARLALCQRDKFLQGCHLDRRMYDDHVRYHRHLRDRLEVLDRVVGHLRVQRDVDGVRTGHAHHQRVAVGGGFGHHLRPYVAAGAAAVFHHHRLLPGGAHLVGKGARGDVGSAAGREGHDDTDLPRGEVGLRERGAGREQRYGEEGYAEQKLAQHGRKAFQNSRSHRARIFTSTSADSTALANTKAFSLGTLACA